eukprot:3578358-Amphidinium_carterae.1
MHKWRSNTHTKHTTLAHVGPQSQPCAAQNPNCKAMHTAVERNIPQSHPHVCSSTISHTARTLDVSVSAASAITTCWQD